MRCKVCGSPMKPLFTSWYCDNPHPGVLYPEGEWWVWHGAEARLSVQNVTDHSGNFHAVVIHHDDARVGPVFIRAGELADWIEYMKLVSCNRLGEVLSTFPDEFTFKEEVIDDEV